MKFHSASRLLYLETDAFYVSLGAGLLQVREGMYCGFDEVQDNVNQCPIAFGSKSLSCAGQLYSNIKWEALGIQHGLKKFHHYCIDKEVCLITDHKLLMAVVNKDVATLSQWLQ